MIINPPPQKINNKKKETKRKQTNKYTQFCIYHDEQLVPLGIRNGDIHKGHCHIFFTFV